MRKYFFAALMILFMTSILAACDKDGDDEKAGAEAIGRKPEPEMWEQALKKKTIPYFDAYLDYYPGGPHAREAKQSLRELWDEKVAGLSPEEMEPLKAVIETNYGTIKFKFFPKHAPNHSRNFIKLAESRFYDGLTYHRLVKKFVIQGGDPLGTGRGGPGYTIKQEFNELPHLEGTVAMARSSDPDSAGSQFYICLAPQPRLDGQYTVFGQVVEGMDVVQTIGNLPTDRSKAIRAVVDELGRRLDIGFKADGKPERPLPEGAKIMEKPVMQRVYIEGW